MLTPVDIENKEFAKAFRGYDSIEVDEFMHSLINDYEKLYRENGSLKEKNALLSETLENYKGMETTMQNAILVAQKTAEDIKQNAYEKSNTITKEAEIKAGNIISDAEKKASELEKEYSALKKEMNTFKARMNSLLQTYLRLLEDMPESEASNLEKDIEKIQKQNQERADFMDLTINKQVTEPAPEIKPEEVKKEEPAPLKEENTYAPKKVNPLVDELLKKRASAQEAENISDKVSENESQGSPDEIIIDLSKNNKPYDVFSDESL